MSQFAQPGIANPEDKIVWADSLGALLLFFPTRLDTKIPTQHGETDAVAAKVVRLEDGRVWENGMVFPTALVTQLKGAIPDGMVLGRLAQGDNKKGNPPWLLQPHTAEDVAKAEAWLAANPRNQFAQAPQPQAPAPQWGGAPTAAPAAPQWGAPAPAAPAPGGWGAPAAPAQNGWGAPAPVAPEGVAGQAPAAWQNAGAPVPPPAPVVPPVDPGLVAFLTAKGFQVQPGMNQEYLVDIANKIAAAGG